MRFGIQYNPNLLQGASVQNKSFILTLNNNGDTRETNRGHLGEFASADAKDFRTGRRTSPHWTADYRTVRQIRHALHLPKGFVSYWRNILPATLTALATCSSAASIPVNTSCAKNIGVPDDIADTTIPLGTSFHKDGSIIGSVFKIMFLVYLFGSNVSTPKILGIALLATLLITAVPIGGGTISETLIITMLGFPIATLGMLTIIATIIDPPATMLNVVGDSASSMLVARIIDGKKWLTTKDKKNK